MKKINLYVVLLLSLLVIACSNNKNNERPQSGAEPTSDITIADSTAGPKLVKTAEMRMKVRDVEKSRQDIYKLTSGMNGMVKHQSTESVEMGSETMPFSADSAVVVSSYQINSMITVRIPSEKLEDFMNVVAKLAILVNSRSVHVEDKTLDFIAANEKNKNRLEWLNKQNKNAAKKTELDVKNEQIDDAIAKKRIDLDVAYSTVDLTVYQSGVILKERIANTDLGNHRISFWSRVSYALGNGWGIFTDFLVGLANLWVFVVVVIATIFGIRYYRKRNRKTIN